jgi:chromate transporter
MLIGLVRAGPAGAFLAWLGFTLPSAVLIAAFAAALGGIEGHDPPAWFPGLLDGLFAAAAAVVAQAVLGLAESVCIDRETKTLALGAMALSLALRPLPGLQWLPIVLGLVTGALWLNDTRLKAEPLPVRVPRAASMAAAAVFVALIALTLLPCTPVTALVATLVRAGSLVFGGGHVVLPLLQSMISEGLVSSRDFFAGYGAVQAMPGPLFTFASFLGYANRSPLHGALGAAVATVLIFLPSFALIFALAPVWNRLTTYRRAGGALRGANAAVVGLLGAVLYDPIIVSFGTNLPRVAIALAAFALIGVWRVAPWIVVVSAALLGALLRA